MTTTIRKQRGSFQINHIERATLARQQPSEWTNVRSFEHFDNAADCVRSIRKGTRAAYQPPGSFQARLVEGPQFWPHRPWTVYCRYVGGA